MLIITTSCLPPFFFIHLNLVVQKQSFSLEHKNYKLTNFDFDQLVWSNSAMTSPATKSPDVQDLMAARKRRRRRRAMSTLSLRPADLTLIWVGFSWAALSRTPFSCFFNQWQHSWWTRSCLVRAKQCQQPTAVHIICETSEKLPQQRSLIPDLCFQNMGWGH